MYCKNLKNALERIQQDTKQNKTYYVGPDEQLKVLLKTKKPAYKKDPTVNFIQQTTH